MRIRRFSAALAVGALVLGACGSDDDSAAPDSTGSQPASDTVESTPADTDTVDTTAGTDTVDTGADSVPVGTDAAGDGEVCTADHVGGTIAGQNYSMVRGFDPVQFQATGSTGGAELVSVFDSLMTYDSESDSFVPRVAESATPNDDFTEWTVVIRDGVTFGDGTPLTSEQVVAHYERIRDGAFPYTGAVKSTISAIEPVDDQTIKFTLTKPWARFPWLLAST